MFRLVAASRAVREAVPGELAPVFWVITAFGSARLLLIALSAFYWTRSERRRDALGVLAAAFVALAATLTLKSAFDLPRPPAAVHRYPVDVSGSGFPSGHAIAVTVVFGSLLVALDRHRDPRAVGVAAAGALLVGLSRVVLGVHYLGDVLAGYAAGLVVLALVVTLLQDRDPARGFAAAAALAVPALALTRFGPDAVVGFGASVGAAVAAVALDTEAGPAPARGRAVGVAVVAIAAAGLAAAQAAGGGSAVVAFPPAVLLGAAIVGFPAVAASAGGAAASAD